MHPTPGSGGLDEAFDVDLVTGVSRLLAAPDAAALDAAKAESDDARVFAVSTSFGFGGANAALVLSTAARGPAP